MSYDFKWDTESLTTESRVTILPPATCQGRVITTRPRHHRERNASWCRRRSGEVHQTKSPWGATDWTVPAPRWHPRQAPPSSAYLSPLVAAARLRLDAERRCTASLSIPGTFVSSLRRVRALVLLPFFFSLFHLAAITFRGSIGDLNNLAHRVLYVTSNHLFLLICLHVIYLSLYQVIDADNFLLRRM